MERGLEIVERRFDLSGGALCLDFANTLDDRPDPRPNEYLQEYGDLVAFARQTGSLSEGRLDRLLADSEHWPAVAAAVLGRALDLREAIFRLFRALAAGDPTPNADLEALNLALAAALSRARIAEAPVEPRFAWSWADEPPGLDTPLWPIVRSAAELLTSSDLSALRLCASDRCDWLFLDTSRNGSRRWCSMRTCGNRAKARRHHARVRAAATTPSSGETDSDRLHVRQSGHLDNSL